MTFNSALQQFSCTEYFNIYVVSNKFEKKNNHGLIFTIFLLLHQNNILQ